MGRNNVVEANIRGFRFIGNSSGSTMLKLTHDTADPFTIQGRFPLGMDGFCKFIFGFEMLEEASGASYGTVVGGKRDFGSYMRMSPVAEVDFEYGSDNGLMFEFRIPGHGEYKLWLPLDRINKFVEELSARMPAVAANNMDHELSLFFASEGIPPLG